MNDEPTPWNSGDLDQVISEFHRMPIPELPSTQLLLSRLPFPDAPTRPFCWEQPISARRSIFMRRGFHFTTAATLLLVALGWLLVSSPVTSALAQAIEAAAKHDIASCKFTTSAQLEDPVYVGPAKSEEVLYFDLKLPRFRIDRHEKTCNDTVSSSWIFVQDNRLDRVLLTSDLKLIVAEEDAVDERQREMIRMVKSEGGLALGKRAKLFRTSDKGLHPFTNLKTEKTLLEILREFQDDKDAVALEDTLDGRSTMRYRLEKQDRTSTLWVDLETKLPVRIEEERRQPVPNFKEWKCVLSDFAWYVDAKKDHLFSVRPPDGYDLEDHTNDKN
jgi:hypothetical protein